MSIEENKVTLILDISEPEEQEIPGVFKTYLSHPKLQGRLEIVHSEFAGKDEMLKALDQNIVGGVMDVIKLIGGLVDGYKTTTGSTGAPTKDSKR